MSKVDEYLALIPKGLKKFPELLDGVKNQALMDLNMMPKEKAFIILDRRNICKKCPYMSKNAVNGFTIENHTSKYKTNIS